MNIENQESKRRIFNHNVENSIGSIFNHGMEDAAPKTKQVFNHDLSDCSDEDELSKLLGVFKYPGRVLGETNPNDIIQLHPDLNDGWKWITSHYDKIGLSHTKNVIWDDNFNIVENFLGYELSVFFFGSKAHSARPNKKWFDLAEKMNSKNSFMALCHDLSIDVPKTDCFENVNQFCGCNGTKFPVYLKISTSVSGLGVIKCEDESELEKEISLIEPEVDFQIQEEVEAKTFINVQYVAYDKYLKRVAITEQILEECQYAGSRSTNDYENVWEITDQIAMKMQQEGMRGYFAFDLAVTEDGKYLAIECNPRYNGSTYPTNIAKKLGIGSWVAKNFETNITTFDNLNLEGIEYDSSRKSGVIVVNWGCISDRKIGVLIAGNQDEQNRIEEKLKTFI
ncbi:MAG: ATP-grasp domain-containing protein [Patescibacteria group bacterium]|nr:ATP-grasp domain-containing protein [Patescibacteria group bacterium]